MCLIAVAYQATPDYELLAIANRDEFYARPAAPLHLWDPGELPEDHVIAGGQDFQAGGSWLAAGRLGGARRFAAVTNYRNPDQTPGRRSRGELVASFLEGKASAAEFAAKLTQEAMSYGGYNLLLMDDSGLHYCTNRWPKNDSSGVQAWHAAMPPGVYVLSNHLLDSPWPKSVRLRTQVERLLSTRRTNEPLDPADWLDLMLDTTQAESCELPKTGLPAETEQQLSSAFISLPDYGTRSSTFVSIGEGKAAEISMTERRFSPTGLRGETTLRL